MTKLTESIQAGIMDVVSQDKGDLGYEEVNDDRLISVVLSALKSMLRTAEELENPAPTKKVDDKYREGMVMIPRDVVEDMDKELDHSIWTNDPISRFRKVIKQVLERI